MFPTPSPSESFTKTVQTTATFAPPPPAAGDKRPRVEEKQPPHQCDAKCIIEEFNRYIADLVALKQSSTTLPGDQVKQARVLLLNEHHARLVCAIWQNWCSICASKWVPEMRLYALTQRDGSVTADVSPQ